MVGFIGYLAGDWHGAAVRSIGFSAAQNVALRFPEADAAVADAATDPKPGAIRAAALQKADLALLNPEPMVPVNVPHPTESQQQAAISPPSEIVSQPMPSPSSPRTEVRPIVVTPRRAELRQSALEKSAARRADRPGFLLNDVQIARIKQRLHLTPDQEQMWPAVEAALRNIAYATSHAEHRRGARENMEASLDADSAEVQGLKSAAIPLIMSFNDEQKNEVRSLAHVMGLDKLASEF